jgi:hypothetical protein
MGKRRDTHNFVLGMAAGQQAKSNNSSQRPKMHFPLNLWSVFFKKAERYRDAAQKQWPRQGCKYDYSKAPVIPTKIWWESGTHPSNQVFTTAQCIYDLQIMAAVVNSSQNLLSRHRFVFNL